MTLLSLLVAVLALVGLGLAITLAIVGSLPEAIGPGEEPRILRIGRVLGRVYAAVAGLATAVVVLNALFGTVQVMVNVAPWWPEGRVLVDSDSTALTQPTVTTVNVMATGLSLAPRLLLAGGALLDGFMIIWLAVTFAGLCARAAGEAPFAPAIAQAVHRTAYVVLICGLAGPALRALGSSMAGNEMLGRWALADETVTTPVSAFGHTIDLWPVAAYLFLLALVVLLRRGMRFQMDAEGLV